MSESLILFYEVDRLNVIPFTMFEIKLKIYSPYLQFYTIYYSNSLLFTPSSNYCLLRPLLKFKTKYKSLYITGQYGMEILVNSLIQYKG